uniref:Uncharacterized protein n=1 Tax=Nelumbo nucifera TaxID=4432 RepID=A0A822YVA7_NELNU|nr:TPA_asm: hypothetical protein HUJ06_006673 [Nelumbo nucifera]
MPEESSRINCQIDDDKVYEAVRREHSKMFREHPLEEVFRCRVDFLHLMIHGVAKLKFDGCSFRNLGNSENQAAIQYIYENHHTLRNRPTSPSASTSHGEVGYTSPVTSTSLWAELRFTTQNFSVPPNEQKLKPTSWVQNAIIHLKCARTGPKTFQCLQQMKSTTTMD